MRCASILLFFILSVGHSFSHPHPHSSWMPPHRGVSDHKLGLDVLDIAPFFVGVGIPDATNLEQLVVDYGGKQIKGDKLSVAEDGDMLANPPTVWWMSQDDTFAAWNGALSVLAPTHASFF